MVKFLIMVVIFNMLGKVCGLGIKPEKRTNIYTCFGEKQGVMYN